MQLPLLQPHTVCSRFWLEPLWQRISSLDEQELAVVVPRLRVHVFARVSVCIFARVCVCVHVYMCGCAFVCKGVYVCMRVSGLNKQELAVFAPCLRA